MSLSEGPCCRYRLAQGRWFVSNQPWLSVGPVFGVNAGQIDEVLEISGDDCCTDGLGVRGDE